MSQAEIERSKKVYMTNWIWINIINKFTILLIFVQYSNIIYVDLKNIGRDKKCKIIASKLYHFCIILVS